MLERVFTLMQMIGLGIGVILIGGIVGVLLLLRPIVALLRTIVNSQERLRRRQDRQDLVFNELLSRIAARTDPKHAPDDPDGTDGDGPTRPRLRIVRDTTAGLVLVPLMALGGWFLRHPIWVGGVALAGLVALISGPLLTQAIPGGGVATPPTVTRTRAPRTPARTPPPTSPAPSTVTPTGPGVVPPIAVAGPAQEVGYRPVPGTSVGVPPVSATPPPPSSATPPPGSPPPTTPPTVTAQPALCLGVDVVVLAASACVG